jgi:hypothetical protein
MAKKSQIQKFCETACAIECNEPEAAFDRPSKIESAAITKRSKAMLALRSQ